MWYLKVYSLAIISFRRVHELSSLIYADSLGGEYGLFGSSNKFIAQNKLCNGTVMHLDPIAFC